MFLRVLIIRLVLWKFRQAFETYTWTRNPGHSTKETFDAFVLDFSMKKKQFFEIKNHLHCFKGICFRFKKKLGKNEKDKNTSFSNFAPLIE